MLTDTTQRFATDPRYIGPLQTATHEGIAGSPGDGPYLILQLEVAEGIIHRAAYQTYGCITAMACGGATAALVTGRSPAQALQVQAEDLLRLLGNVPEGKEHCAQLAAEALHRAVVSGLVPK